MTDNNENDKTMDSSPDAVSAPKTNRRSTAHSSEKGWSGLSLGRRWEITLVVCTTLTLVIVVLSPIPADYALVVIVPAQSIAWTIMLEQCFRRYKHDAAGFHWAPYKSVALGIVAPLIMAIVLPLRYGLEAMLGIGVSEEPATAIFALILSLGILP